MMGDLQKYYIDISFLSEGALEVVSKVTGISFDNLETEMYDGNVLLKQFGNKFDTFSSVSNDSDLIEITFNAFVSMFKDKLDEF